MAAAAVGARGGKPRKWFALTSAYAELDLNERIAVVATLQASGALGDIRQALRPLSVFYPACPLSFLFEASPPVASSLADFKIVLESLFDRWGTPGTFIQANAVYIAFTSDMLKVLKGLALANFPAIEAFPHTEESKIVAGSVRATVSTFYGQFKDASSTAWISYFWNRGLELEPCSVREDEA